MIKLDYSRPIRATAYTWLLYGSLGGVGVPHGFVAGRASWAFDKQVMKLIDIEIALVQIVPESRIETFLAHLEQFEKHIKEKKPAKLLILANVTRSIEITPALWRRSPEAIPILIRSGVKCDWNFPHYTCGRAALLSRLQLWVADKKIISSLPDVSDDPLIWNWTRVRDALSSVTNRPPRPEDELGIPTDDMVEEDVVLGVAQLPWWFEQEIPTVYADEKQKTPYSKPYTDSK